MIENQVITPLEMAKVRTLSDRHLILLVALIHDFGWPDARVMLTHETQWPKGLPQRTINPKSLVALRTLDDFDLTMIISDIHDNGWPMAAKTLDLAVEASWKSPDKKTVQ